MKTRINFKDEGQDLQHLDIDSETGRICGVSAQCSATVANIYIGGIVDAEMIQEGQRLPITDVGNAGRLIHTRWYVANTETL